MQNNDLPANSNNPDFGTAGTKSRKPRSRKAERVRNPAAYVHQIYVSAKVAECQRFRSKDLHAVWIGTHNYGCTDGVYAVKMSTLRPLYIFIPSRNQWFGNRDFLPSTINSESPYSHADKPARLMTLANPHVSGLPPPTPENIWRNEGWRSTHALRRLIDLHRADKQSTLLKHQAKLLKSQQRVLKGIDQERRAEPPKLKLTLKPPKT